MREEMREEMREMREEIRQLADLIRARETPGTETQ